MLKISINIRNIAETNILVILKFRFSNFLFFLKSHTIITILFLYGL